MLVTNPPVTMRTPVEYHLLVSDLHIGSSSTNYERIKADLDAAKRLGAHVHINGDIFDAILPKDMKRYDPRALHDRLQGRADVLNAVVEWGVELLAPVASQIHEIGTGNHDTAVEKHHSVDPTQWLIDRLRPHGLPDWVDNGGYYGYYRRSVQNEHKRYWTWWMYRSHGAGGASPVTKGIIDFGRMRTWCGPVEIVWVGHKHNKMHVHASFMKPLDSGKVISMVGHDVMTGAYLDTYGVDPNTRPSYASQWNIAPQPMGGFIMKVQYCGDYSIKFDMLEPTAIG